jgi:hypothetical protein
MEPWNQHYRRNFTAPGHASVTACCGKLHVDGQDKAQPATASKNLIQIAYL